MKIEAADITRFHKQGYLLMEDVLEDKKVEKLSDALNEISGNVGPEFFRDDSGAIRTIFSPETFSEEINELISDSSLVEPLMSLFDEPFYLFQSKFNNKKSLASGVWTWHQDFTFWEEDGMLEAKAITVAIYLSDVSAFSGPIICVPGTQKHGRIECLLNNPDGVHDENLKYIITPETLKEVTNSYGGIKSTESKKGSVLFFHSNLLHASFQNMYYDDRKILMFTYNPISNKAKHISNPRPEYMVKRDYTPIQQNVNL